MTESEALIWAVFMMFLLCLYYAVRSVVGQVIGMVKKRKEKGQ